MAKKYTVSDKYLGTLVVEFLVDGNSLGLEDQKKLHERAALLLNAAEDQKPVMWVNERHMLDRDNEDSENCWIGTRGREPQRTVPLYLHPSPSLAKQLEDAKAKIEDLQSNCDWYAVIADTMNTWAREAQVVEFNGDYTRGENIVFYLRGLHGNVNAQWHKREDRLNVRIAELKAEIDRLTGLPDGPDAKPCRYGVKTRYGKIFKTYVSEIEARSDYPGMEVVPLYEGPPLPRQPT